MQQYTGFVYLWFDSEKKMFYLGSHAGTIEDGYIGSGIRFMRAYNIRPNSFKRRIIEYTFGDYKSLLAREQAWLNLIKDEELHVRYYNQKKWATGGSVKGRKQPKTEEHKQKLRKPRKDTSKFHAPKTKEHRRKISEGLKNADLSHRSGPMLGKIHTERSKHLMSISTKDRPKCCCIFCRQEVLINHLIQYHRESGCGSIDISVDRKPMLKFSVEGKLNVSISKMSFRLKTPLGDFRSYKDFEIATGIPAQKIKNIFINLKRKPTDDKLKLFNLENLKRSSWEELGFEKLPLD